MITEFGYHDICSHCLGLSSNLVRPTKKDISGWIRKDDRKNWVKIHRLQRICSRKDIHRPCRISIIFSVYHASTKLMAAIRCNEKRFVHQIIISEYGSWGSFSEYGKMVHDTNKALNGFCDIGAANIHKNLIETTFSTLTLHSTGILFCQLFLQSIGE